MTTAASSAYYKKLRDAGGARVSVQLTAEQVECMDALRGNEPRGAWLREMAFLEVNPPAEIPPASTPSAACLPPSDCD